MKNIDPNLAKRFRLRDTQGALVVGVEQQEERIDRREDVAGWPEEEKREKDKKKESGDESPHSKGAKHQ